MAAWQGSARPHVDRPLVAVFAGNHGVVAQGVSALSGVGHAGDGGEFPGRRRGDQPDLQDVRSLAQSVRTGAGEADRRHHPGAGARREGLRGDDGLRHGGARLRARPARAWRDGHRQYDGGRGHLSCALWRAGGGLGRPRDRRRRRGPAAQGRRRARRGRASTSPISTIRCRFWRASAGAKPRRSQARSSPRACAARRCCSTASSCARRRRCCWPSTTPLSTIASPPTSRPSARTGTR